MKFASKFVVVPYMPQITNEAEEQITSLDEKMSLILHDPNLPVDVKVKLYNKTLSEYNQSMTNYNLTVANQTQNTLAEQSSRIVNQMVEKLQPEFDNLKTKPVKDFKFKKVSLVKKPIASEKMDDFEDAAEEIPPPSITTTPTASTTETPSPKISSKLSLEFKEMDGFYVPKSFSVKRIKELNDNVSKKYTKEQIEAHLTKTGYKNINDKLKALGSSATKTQQSAAINKAFIDEMKEMVKMGMGQKHIKHKKHHINKSNKKHHISGGHKENTINWKFKNFF